MSQYWKIRKWGHKLEVGSLWRQLKELQKSVTNPKESKEGLYLKRFCKSTKKLLAEATTRTRERCVPR